MHVQLVLQIIRVLLPRSGVATVRGKLLPQLVTNAAFASLSGHAQQIPKHGTASPQTEVPSLALCTCCAGCVHELVCGLRFAVVFNNMVLPCSCLPIVCLGTCLTRHSGSISFVSARGTQRTPSSQNQTCPEQPAQTHGSGQTASVSRAESHPTTHHSCLQKFPGTCACLRWKVRVNARTHAHTRSQVHLLNPVSSTFTDLYHAMPWVVLP